MVGRIRQDYFELGDWIKRSVCKPDVDFFPHPPKSNVKDRATKWKFWQRNIKPVRERYCNHCPVRSQCFKYGLDMSAEGIYGGHLLLPKRFVFNPNGRNPRGTHENSAEIFAKLEALNA